MNTPKLSKSKIRVSWSVLSQWKAGNYDYVYNYYEGIEADTTSAMLFGQMAHSAIEKGKAIFIPTTPGFKKPVKKGVFHETKLVVELEDWLTLSVVIDYMDNTNNIIADFKTGKSKGNPLQLYIYDLALSVEQHLMKPTHAALVYLEEELTNHKHEILYRAYDLYKLNDVTKATAREWVTTLAADMFTKLKEKYYGETD